MSAAGFITPEDVVANYGVTISYVYKMASRRKWRRIRYEGRAHYLLADVDQSFGKD